MSIFIFIFIKMLISSGAMSKLIQNVSTELFPTKMAPLQLCPQLLTKIRKIVLDAFAGAGSPIVTWQTSQKNRAKTSKIAKKARNRKIGPRCLKCWLQWAQVPVLRFFYMLFIEKLDDLGYMTLADILLLQCLNHDCYWEKWGQLDQPRYHTVALILPGHLEDICA